MGIQIILRSVLIESRNCEVPTSLNGQVKQLVTSGSFMMLSTPLDNLTAQVNHRVKAPHNCKVWGVHGFPRADSNG